MSSCTKGFYQPRSILCLNLLMHNYGKLVLGDCRLCAWPQAQEQLLAQEQFLAPERCLDVKVVPAVSAAHP